MTLAILSIAAAAILAAFFVLTAAESDAHRNDESVGLDILGWPMELED